MLNLVLCHSASSIAPVKIFFINVSAFCNFSSNVLYKNYEKRLEVFDEVTEQPDGWDDESY